MDEHRSVQMVKGMVIFVQIVQCGNFSQAAQQLNMTKSAVSKSVSKLENHLNVRLLNRSTRHVSTTEIGRKFYEHCLKVTDSIDSAVQFINDAQSKLVGTITLTCPTAFCSNVLLTELSDFLNEHPSLNLDLRLEDEVIDIISNGIDVAVRIGHLEESNLIAIRLATAKVLLCATPSYLNKRGRPKTPSELTPHDCLVFSSFKPPYAWNLKKDGKIFKTYIRNRVRFNNINAMRDFAIAGHGITVLPMFSIFDDIESGKLEQVLPEYQIEDVGIYALYPHREYLPAKTKALIKFLSERFQQAVWAKEISPSR